MVAINANELEALVKVDLNESRNIYGSLFQKVSFALAEADPMNFAVIENEMLDEYDSETATILPRLGNAKSAENVALIVYEEFLKWFDTWSINSFKTVDEFQPVATKIWDMWLDYKTLNQ